MRTTAQLLTILFVCLAGCWLLDREVGSRPTLISGEIVDWGTGQPAPYTDVRIARLNFSQVVARTDKRGQFAFSGPKGPGVYFLFAGSPRYGRLLQTTFGQTIVAYRAGQHIRKVVIPAIPATELSGHVYATDGHPLSGCNVSGFTPDNSDSHKSVELQARIAQAFTYHIAQADDPNKFIEVETDRTDSHGAYTFKRLGADRYFVLARCLEPGTGGENSPFSWEPTAYPQENSIATAQQIVLLPGEHRSGIDLRMQRKRSYVLEGKVMFSDHSAPKPWPQAIYGHDLQMFRSDRALTSTWIGQEACDWNANAGAIRCHSLFPGTYTLYFDISGGPGAFHMQTQFAEVSYTIRSTAKQLPLMVQLHNVPESRYLELKTGSSGTLDLRKVCESAEEGRPAIQVLAWGHGHAGGACYYMTFRNDTRLPLPEDKYIVNAFEAAFVPRHSSYLGENSKFEALLMQHGISVHIRDGQTSEPNLPVASTEEQINTALDSLRSAR
ncbi:MAG: carboxypeptidase regulatory-like domain-containing protein [Acidobacteriaceae bacterium]|nr:carboxypeptidase regulatory-like domain-containing protein [Acidobacteriaceae bacterium]